MFHILRPCGLKWGHYILLNFSETTCHSFIGCFTMTTPSHWSSKMSDINLVTHLVGSPLVAQWLESRTRNRVNVQRSLHPQYQDWGALEQVTEPSTAPRRRSINNCPLPRVCVHGVCVCSLLCVCVHCCVCAHLDGLNAEHKFRVWVTILGHISRHFHFHLWKYYNIL